jgi:signal transduction histidine kinase
MEDTLISGDMVGNRPSVRQALAGHEVTALESDLPSREAADGYALRAAVPIRRGSRIVGAVVVGRQLGTIFAERIGRALSANVNLIAGNQLTGTTLQDSQGLPVTGQAEPASILARIATGKMTIAMTQEGDSPVLSGLAPLRGSDGRWAGAIEVVRPLNPLYDVIRSLSLLLLGLGLGVIALGTLLALGISRRLTARLSVLEAAASRIAGLARGNEPLGELHMETSVAGNDEIASLAGSFSSMMTALDERIAASAELYAASQARVRELSGLAEIARLLTDVSSVRATLDVLGEHVSRLVGAEAVAIWLPGEEARPTLHGGFGLPERYEDLSNAILEHSTAMGFETAAQTVLRTGRVEYRDLRVEEPLEHASQAALLAHMRSLGWTWATAVPLRVQARIVGAMTCYTRAELSLSGSDLSLLTTIADQAAVAIENARLSEQAQEVAVLEERQRLARELHDSVSQALYGIALGARTARTLLDRDPGRVAEPLEYVLAQAEAGLTEMRALIFELRPQALESEGLVAALRKQVEAIQVRHGVAAQVSLSAEPNVPFAVKEAMYRIAQEALHNTVKHARARSIELRLGGENGNITLEVRDDGKGFDTRGPFPGHLGLRSMRERALRLGGSLTVVSAPGEGTCIQVIVPSPARNGSRDG